jgi:hypothetical protein
VSVIPEDPPLSGGCHADRACSRATCFQARVEATAGQVRVRRRANACASHLVDMIQALTSWARDSDLAGSRLTVLAIDPGAAARARGMADPNDHGLAFSTIPINGLAAWISAGEGS